MPTRIPKTIPGVDFKKLPLTPTDGYLLTRVNGSATIRDIAKETGLYEPEVIESFEKLDKLKVVTFGSVEDAIKAMQAPVKVGVLSAKYEESELLEECDLDVEQKKRVLGLFHALEDNDYYTLLGVAKEADKKQVKKAYYDVALPMHPDKFFRKKLGTFKPKMEAVFAKLTLAHDTLVDKVKRAEYDIYIREVAHTKGMEAMLARAMEEAHLAQEAALRAAGAQSSPPPPLQQVSAPSEPAPPGVDPAVVDARRRALAARLLGGRRPSSIAPPVAEPKLKPIIKQNSDDAMEDIRRRYVDRLADAKTAQITRYVQAAEMAVEKQDWIAASNAYRIALDLQPDDPEIVVRAKAAQKEANTLLAESYSKQAAYDERHERWPEAARSWTRVAKLRPEDPKVADKAAYAIAKSDGDLHEAATLAQVAVKLEPSTVGYRLTLANILIQAGKPALAKREVQAAAQIAPNDVSIQNLMKRLS